MSAAVPDPAHVRRVAREPSVDDLLDDLEARYLARQARSRALHERASRVLAGGATSSWMITRPATMWMSHGQGARVWDVDDHEYVDLHAGYGTMLAGHAHPLIVDAVARRAAAGTHFAQPTEDAVAVAENLAARFGLPQWRFCNSGTEATMDAVHLMRAVTGRDVVIKVEGSYHGHHDSVMVSVHPDRARFGPVERPTAVPAGSGIPQAMVDLVRVVPFNDLPALERVLDEERGRVAGFLLEPMMTNCGLVAPDPGYLEGVRALTRRHGVVLAYDEVKTGLTVHPGGATGLYGVKPDLVCLAKALGGGTPCGAIGGIDEVMGAIVDGRYAQVGTFNGNPLTMAATRVSLEQILVPEAYDRMAQLSRRMAEGAVAKLGSVGVTAYGVWHGAKGCLVFHGRPVRNYRDFLKVEPTLSHLHWLVQHEGGVLLPPWGKSEQWTVSVQHGEAEVDRFLHNVAVVAEQLSRVASFVPRQRRDALF